MTARAPSTLLLVLAGPLQAWGDQSRFERRLTRREPTKSGILGLIAAAQGRPRDAELTDLGVLRFGVRSDQEGTLVRDYQTAQRPDSVLGKGWANPKLSYRYYLADARFLVGLEGDRSLLEGISDAIRSPEFPLYLGRRACPPSRPIVYERELEPDVNGEHPPRAAIVDDALGTALRREPWIAERQVRRRAPVEVTLQIVRDADPGVASHETIRDMPVSFSPERREYAWREVVRESVKLPNPDGRPRASSTESTTPTSIRDFGDHDPMSEP